VSDPLSLQLILSILLAVLIVFVVLVVVVIALLLLPPPLLLLLFLLLLPPPSSYSEKSQMLDAGAAGGPGRPRASGLGRHNGAAVLGAGLRVACRGPGRGHGARGGKAEGKEWISVIKLGRLVLEGDLSFSLLIKESEIINFSLGASLKDEVLKILPVQKLTSTADSRLLSILGTTMVTLVLALSAPRR
jgi:energy-coupling factor transporter transmembrane protein EcfT